MRFSRLPGVRSVTSLEFAVLREPVCSLSEIVFGLRVFDKAWLKIRGGGVCFRQQKKKGIEKFAEALEMLSRERDLTLT